VANLVYTRGIFEIFGANTDLDSADLRLLLLKNTYSANKDHNVVNDVISGSLEISVVGYSRQTLASKTLTEDDTNDMVYLDANDVTFAGLATGQTFQWAVLFRHTGSDATAPVIAGYDLGATPTAGADVVVQWATPANGAVLKGV
jgi:hypothetical protein